MSEPRQPSSTFHTTRWSVVLDALAPERESRSALEVLCSTYWYPLYAYVRRRGHEHHATQDLVQAFFARLIEKRDWRVDPGRGRFRAFLAAAMKHFMANERERAAAQKRGGAAALVSIDEHAERRFVDLAVDGDTPERAFERGFALTLLDLALQRLADEQSKAGKAALFERLRPFFGPDTAPPYVQLAGELGASEGALRVALHRLRRRYGELVRLAVAELVTDPVDVDAEIAGLLDALSQ
jgi:RNA polymerase sigma-70 factor (ECF subfamily)